MKLKYQHKSLNESNVKVTRAMKDALTKDMNEK